MTIVENNLVYGMLQSAAQMALNGEKNMHRNGYLCFSNAYTQQ